MAGSPAGAGGLRWSRSIVGTFIVFGLVGTLLVAAGRRDYPILHTILDTGMFLLSGVLALLLWDIGVRIGAVLPRWVALSLAATCLLELIHTLIAIEWSGSLGPIAESAGVLRQATWPPAAYLFPLGVLASLWLLRRGYRGILNVGAAFLALGVGLLAFFCWLPRYVPPTSPGLARPVLIAVPVLWVMIGLAGSRLRGAERLIPALVMIVPVMLLAHVAMLYSRSPHDTLAMVAHLGKVTAYLVLLLSVMQMASSDMAERIRADRRLADMNQELERRVERRTAELESANRSLATEVDVRRGAERHVQAQVERLNLLHQITRAIGERQDLKSIFQVVVRSLEDRLPVDFCCICLYDQPAHALVVTSVGLRSQALALGVALPEEARIGVDENGLSRCVQGHLVYEPDIGHAVFPFPSRLAGGGMRSLVAAPLLAESRVFGALIAARTEPRGFSSGECEFLRQLSEHAALAAHQGQLHGFLQAAYDDLRRTQQAVMQQERLGALGQMASGIAHDINNAISPVMLYTEALLEQEPNLSSTARQDLEIIQRAIQDVAQTVARMGEFYRPREAELAQAPVRMNGLVGHVCDLTRARWSDIPQQRGIVIDLQTRLAPDLPVIVGVESEIRDALTNLVLNAVDAMPEGGTLTLQTRAAGETVYVEVSDTGQGMTEETRRRCLEPFFTTKGDRGSGLGLAMVYGIVQRHGAEMEMVSAPDQGTTIRISFPVPAAVTRPADGAVLRRRLARLRILVVDDDPLILKSVGDILKSDGHEIITANGGQEGIDAFSAALGEGNPFGVVVTDLGMPRIDGRRVAEAVKLASPSTPVILLTGWGQRLIAEDDVPSHVDRALGKPPKLRELREALSDCCGEDSS